MLPLLQVEAERDGDVVYVTDGVNMAGSRLQMKQIESYRKNAGKKQQGNIKLDSSFCCASY